MRLGSFNIMHGLSLTDGTVEPARFAAAVSALGVDVLGLQEVDLDQPRSGGLDLAAEAAAMIGAGDDDWRFVPTVFGTPGVGWRPADGQRRDDEPAYGIALISRLPVREWRVIDLGRAPVRSPIAIPGGPDRRGRLIMLDDEPRAAIAARVESAGGPLTVVNTHLSFVPGWNAVQLRRLARRLADVPGPLVLLGDLNLPGRLPAALTRWRRLAVTPTYPAHSPRVQLDHVLARGPVGRIIAVQARRVPISDHLALSVDLADPRA
ncbi:metal-dependent hydrolase [Frankia casuarinae]|uniref:Endonuclease/exonuclease/phosphatase n=2 Tax=Frankia TaxID=1854 RepID=Q2J6E4_FRACC|nr:MULTISPECIES: endonuclease/exonuclease/phosphatase family protein [Frankia]ABD13148.1 Endonuclease/exonuclease/phosphatase [Frankia casuarinae]ETA01281.1 metal-dependent hydrolase [Frankia sp. CcI6]EYT90339.1 metal-dependent hydrolase [Frankia casuarinae]KDA42026.1 metal-dependent hydrolase [Frankia sp. BMG5.23]OAA22805.1 metal-dependent hydrolase [Frankia casuarinae]